MREAKENETYDPRRSDHVTGKYGRYVAKKDSKAPSNPLTVQYLCHAYAVPYATFKRWKAESFVSKPHVSEHKGKSVITDKK
jgi:hypothetical protein